MTKKEFQLLTDLVAAFDLFVKEIDATVLRAARRKHREKVSPPAPLPALPALPPRSRLQRAKDWQRLLPLTKELP